MSSENNITSVLKETRVFPPPAEFVAAAHVDAKERDRLAEWAGADPDAFWAEQAKSLHWFKPWSQVLDWSNAPHAKWFVGGQINASDNCIDRHLAARGNKAAIVFEGEPGDSRTLTYRDLHREVCKFANVLKTLGVGKGDRVTIYMPMVPEAAIAMLACARIGAMHSVVFGGFSADAVADRNNDAQSKLVITADGGWRRGKVVPLKANVDAALAKSPSVETCVVLNRCNTAVEMKAGRDVWWHDLMAAASADCPAEPLDSEHPLFILYTSGSTGKPKGVLHTTGGYLLGASLTHKWVFDIKESDVYWCTADVGWITGHSYIVYGPLCNGSTVVMYEGAPNQPKEDRFWEVIEKYKVTVFYTAPTAIRAFIKWGDQHPKAHDLSSLRLLGSVGEPINPEAWMWYHTVIGGGRCPIVDTWWQTETGAIMIAPVPGAVPTKPGSATKPLPGIAAEVVDKSGQAVPANAGGFLVVKRPWPSMMRTIYGDDDRYKATYWSNYPGVYFTADGARTDDDGYIWVMGRVDDVLNVSGHRLSTMEVESALVNHPKVAEAAVVGKPDDLKGEGIVCFVTLKEGNEPTDALKAELKAHVVTNIGALARPDDIKFTPTLPKTRSGKIMRRFLRDVAAGRQSTGDATTLEDFTVLAKLREDEE
ncbi:acetyl-coenzyme a synthetase : Acetyl-coenzyme A synthetase OS=Singulisphaera acidiphila (strain ATCC BAA-1392 / DSM 18658 / VKM B-2454 / MOB10) GN=acsA PE=3 SV=1: AMP-binding: AMP-binding_C [Gemmataceae bacterium]|nr:acetyl-coenzyme a synthetase : Acetyl-coenzyme A synthetase OS=Singulisphaera acidiphila (strain ATCC BAA-1392 / DSM 18658 / VKM B-2454 / MOB10) GN=acsA PE=3 SV=1: AMP-binding: AMP-binding_C [Gemmataceae bacterium]VTT98311.1 acetyl-coenzyme a synthetase : Acetyl-coenzyme A synthetase OS=Singulisphaera acidiphila (strain ATCC BAA-1392 / DSM 18658 / VKM B-2454 / MOB10) GN=acsA PE=3 SV=1: AMP-binding: AMP-binding_C [Gemmataceae bacterium]